MKHTVKRFGVLLGLTGLLVLGACGTEKETKSAELPQATGPIDAELRVEETAEVGEAVTLTVRVTQDGQAVDDANEVKFEVWRHNAKEDSEMMEASLDQDGVYTAEATFGADGIYTVQVHVTARHMHTMPTMEVTVGEPDMVMEDDGHGHHEEAEISLEPKEATAGEATTFVVHVMMEETMLADAEVQLEIFQDGADKHEWVKLESMEAGMYKGDYTFEKNGTYNVQIHVTNGHDLHEHVMKTVEVN